MKDGIDITEKLAPLAIQSEEELKLFNAVSRQWTSYYKRIFIFYTYNTLMLGVSIFCLVFKPNVESFDGFEEVLLKASKDSEGREFLRILVALSISHLAIIFSCVFGYFSSKQDNNAYYLIYYISIAFSVIMRTVVSILILCEKDIYVKFEDDDYAAGHCALLGILTCAQIFLLLLSLNGFRKANQYGWGYRALKSKLLLQQPKVTFSLTLSAIKSD